MPPPCTLVIASHNPGKAREIVALFARPGLDILTARDLALPVPEETADTFEGNAVIKALAAARATGHVALADDSGLVVPALDGEPGVRSRRWCEGGFAEAMARVHRALGDRPREAALVCALAVAWPDGTARSFEGRVDGRLIWPPRGDLGFGYDPMFVPDGSDRTYGEVSREQKALDDPRSRAAAKLRAAVQLCGDR